MSENSELPSGREANPEHEKNFKKSYFDLQYSFAQKVSKKTGIPIERTLYTHTNFNRRFGCLSGNSYDEAHPIWQQYIAGLASHQDNPIDYTYSFFLQAPATSRRSEKLVFGCFQFDPPDADGIVRIHFQNREKSDTSPLSDSAIGNRKGDLTSMFTHIKHAYPNAKHVAGRSWLYNLEQYRRLFPASYGSSREAISPPSRFQGMSYWGQFLDRDGEVRDDVAQQFFAKLDQVDSDHIADAFPKQPYTTKAPIQDFYDFYGIK